MQILLFEISNYDKIVPKIIKILRDNNLLMYWGNYTLWIPSNWKFIQKYSILVNINVILMWS